MHSIIVLLSGTSDGCKLSRRKHLVPKGGLEPPHPCEYMDLNHARLPIPPLRQWCIPARPGYTNREFLVLQTPPLVSIPPTQKRHIGTNWRLMVYRLGIPQPMADQNTPP